MPEHKQEYICGEVITYIMKRNYKLARTQVKLLDMLVSFSLLNYGINQVSPYFVKHEPELE